MLNNAFFINVSLFLPLLSKDPQTHDSPSYHLELWPQLQSALLEPPPNSHPEIRTQLFAIYASAPELLSDPPTNYLTLGPALLTSLADQQPIELRISSLAAATATLRYLTEVEDQPVSEPDNAFYPLLDALAARAHQSLLLPLLARQLISPRLARNALGALADFLRLPPVARLLCQAGPEAWLNPLASLASDRTLPDDTRITVLECLLTFVEAALEEDDGQVQNRQRWTNLVELLLELMAEVEEPDSNWADAVDDNVDEDSALWVVAEENLDRLGRLLGPLPSLLEPLFRRPASDHWPRRHAVLSALGALADACAPLLRSQLPAVLQVVLLGLQDRHIRVVHAAIYALAQLCSSLEVRQGS